MGNNWKILPVKLNLIGARVGTGGAAGSQYSQKKGKYANKIKFSIGIKT